MSNTTSNNSTKKKVIKKIIKKVKSPEKSDSTQSKLDEIQNMEGLEYCKKIKNGSVDLVLTDPPYITSRKTGMDEHAKNAKKCDTQNIDTKTEKEWTEYKSAEEWDLWMKQNKVEDKEKKLKEFKKNYIKYGSIYGKKYAVVTDYGDWDNNFTMEILEKFITEFFRVLKDGGTLIIFFYKFI